MGKKKQKKIYNNARGRPSDKLSGSFVQEDKEKPQSRNGIFKGENPVKKRKPAKNLGRGADYINVNGILPDNLFGSMPENDRTLQSHSSIFTDEDFVTETEKSRIKKSVTKKYLKEIQQKEASPGMDGFVQGYDTTESGTGTVNSYYKGQQQFCTEEQFTEEDAMDNAGFYNEITVTEQIQKDACYGADTKTSYRKKRAGNYLQYHGYKPRQDISSKKAGNNQHGEVMAENTTDSGYSGFSGKDNAYTDGRDCFSGSRQLKKFQRKAEKAGQRLEKAKEKLPKETHYYWERIFDEKTVKARYGLVAAETEKTYKKTSIPQKAVNKLGMEGRNFVHGKIAETEKENAGVEAAHKTEQVSEKFLGFVTGSPGKLEDRKRKKVASLKKKKIAADNIFLEQKYIEENPGIQKRAARKKLQKERIKRRYAKAFRNGQVAGSTSEAAVKTKNTAVFVARKLQEAARVNTAIAITAGVIFLLFVIVMFSFSSCGAMFADTFTLAIAGTYLSEPAEIDAAELYFTQLELDLQEKIDNIENDYPGYDEYSYNTGEIRHNPFILITYISAVYTEFTAGNVASETVSLFNSMYSLELEPVTETRIKVEIFTVTDPVTGATVNVPVETEYEVSILKVTLEVTPLEDILAGRMDTGQKEAFDAYMETKGALQQFSPPLHMDWHSNIKSYYGYRKDPVTGQVQIHKGIDISVPDGTAVYATHNGTVSACGYDNIYGNYIVITDTEGFTTKYACLGSIYVYAGQEITDSMQIAVSGTAPEGAGSCLHLELMYNGVYYNPLFYFENTT